MKRLIFFVIAMVVIVDTYAYSKQWIVEQSCFTDSQPAIMKFPVANKEIKDHQIWTSESGIYCTFKPWTHSQSATLECRGPNGYKVQTSFDCKLNNSKKREGYLWVGIEGVKCGHRSFYVWCE